MSESHEKKHHTPKSLLARLKHTLHHVKAPPLETAVKKRFFRKDFIKRYWKQLTIILIFFILLYAFILRDLPSPANLSNPEYSAQSTKIYDRNGKLLYSIYASKNRTYIPLSQIPDYVKQATISIEDKDFYHHSFFDPRGIARAFIQTVFHQQLQGGSTLTQQLVKTALLTQDRTIQRKIRELLLAASTELLYSKDKILEMYLSYVPYGGATYGIETAAETYFNKKASQLTLGEAALLAGLPNSPTLYSPFGAHPELAKERQKEVLRRMQEDGYITKDQENQAANEELHYANNLQGIKAPHFSLYVKQLLNEKYGEKVVEQGGLKVTTTLDLDIQEAAQASLSSEVEKVGKSLHVGNGAALVTKPATGEILAMIGSKNYFDPQSDGNVNVTLALRQPGSSIKPINYAAGLGKGIVTPATVLIDQATCYPNTTGPSYCPVNYDGKYHGLSQLRFALGNSFNIPAVKMLKLNGVEDMIATASAMGISTFTDPARYGLSLTLGGGEVTMLDMATAFGVFANSGHRVDLTAILKVEDSNGKVLDEYTPPQSAFFAKQVIPEGVAYLISNILADNGARSEAFGSSSELVIPNQTVSVKTGTTDDKRDNWTIGYTPSFLTAVWVGNNDNTPMNPILASGVTGAAPIWHDIMAYLLKGQKRDEPRRPDTVVGATICSDTGILVNTAEGQAPPCPTRFEYFLKSARHDTVKIDNQAVMIDKGTQQIAKPDQKDNIEPKDETVLTDPTGDKYCISCPKPPSPTPTP